MGPAIPLPAVKVYLFILFSRTIFIRYSFGGVFLWTLERSLRAEAPYSLRRQALSFYFLKFHP